MELFYLISLGKLHSRILNFSRLKFSPSLAVFKFFCNSPQRVLHDCLNGARMRNCRLTNSQYSPYYCPGKRKKCGCRENFSFALQHSFLLPKISPQSEEANCCFLRRLRLLYYPRQQARSPYRRRSKHRGWERAATLSKCCLLFLCLRNYLYKMRPCTDTPRLSLKYFQMCCF